MDQVSAPLPQLQIKVCSQFRFMSLILQVMDVPTIQISIALPFS